MCISCRSFQHSRKRPGRDAGKLQSIHSSPQMRQSDGCSPRDQAGFAAFPPSAAAPFTPATALHAFDTGASPDNCASILSLQYSVKCIITQDFSSAIAIFSNLPRGKTGKARQCIQKSGVSTRDAPRAAAQAPQRRKSKQSPDGLCASPLRRKRAPWAIR